jgi:hypothetical protein
MRTDRPPRDPARLTAFLASDRLETLDVPPDDRLCMPALALEAALPHGTSAAVRDACAAFLPVASDFYGVPRPEVRVLAARPRRVSKGGGTIELFGDDTPATMRIRVWMRTAVRQHVTAFGTFFSTLCHEFCHHLDAQRFGWHASPHTRGFYARTAALSHHARGTPLKRLCWISMPGERWRIDWRRTHRSS